MTTKRSPNSRRFATRVAHVYFTVCTITPTWERDGRSSDKTGTFEISPFCNVRTKNPLSPVLAQCARTPSPPHVLPAKNIDLETWPLRCSHLQHYFGKRHRSISCDKKGKSRRCLRRRDFRPRRRPSTRPWRRTDSPSAPRRPAACLLHRQHKQRAVVDDQGGSGGRVCLPRR